MSVAILKSNWLNKERVMSQVVVEDVRKYEGGPIPVPYSEVKPRSLYSINDMQTVYLKMDESTDTVRVSGPDAPVRSVMFAETMKCIPRPDLRLRLVLESV